MPTLQIELPQEQMDRLDDLGQVLGVSVDALAKGYIAAGTGFEPTEEAALSEKAKANLVRMVEEAYASGPPRVANAEFFSELRQRIAKRLGERQ